MGMSVTRMRTLGPNSIVFRLADDGSGGTYDVTQAVLLALTPPPYHLAAAFVAQTTTELTQRNLEAIEIIWTAENATANQPRVTFQPAAVPPLIQYAGPGASGAWSIIMRATHSLAKG